MLAENLIYFHFFHCLKVDTVRAKNVLTVMKSHFLAPAKQESLPCLCCSSACSRDRSELPPGFFSLAHPTDAPARRTDGRIATAGTGRQEAKTIPWNHHQVAKEFILLLQQKMPVLLHKISPMASPLVLLSLYSQFREHIFLVQISSSARAVEVFHPHTAEFQRDHCRWLQKWQKLSWYSQERSPALFLDLGF